MWIRTEKGKMMPVNARTERFYPDPYGERTYVMNDGHVMKGAPAPKGDDVLPCTASGHISHFATCPNAAKHRKRKR